MIKVGDKFRGEDWTGVVDGYVGDYETDRIDGYCLIIQCDDGVTEWVTLPWWCVEDLGVAH